MAKKIGKCAIRLGFKVSFFFHKLGDIVRFNVFCLMLLLKDTTDFCMRQIIRSRYMGWI